MCKVFFRFLLLSPKAQIMAEDPVTIILSKIHKQQSQEISTVQNVFSLHSKFLHWFLPTFFAHSMSLPPTRAVAFEGFVTTRSPKSAWRSMASDDAFATGGARVAEQRLNIKGWRLLETWEDKKKQKDCICMTNRL